MKQEIYLPPQIRRFNGGYIKVLTSEHKDALKEFLAYEFSFKEPHTVAYFQGKGELAVQGWRRYWQKQSKDYLESGMSLGCFEEGTNELVGTMLWKKMFPIPQLRESTLLKPDYWDARDVFDRIYINELAQPYKDILKGKSGKVAYGRGVAVKDKYMGKKLVYMMFLCSQYLVRKNGFEYGYGSSSNIKSEATLRHLKYLIILEYDVTKFEYHGRRIYKDVPEESKYLRLWLWRFDWNKPSLPKL